MKEQVQELIEDMIPKIREEITKELKPQYEEQYREQLQSALQEMETTHFRDNQIEDLRKEIMYNLEQEFEQEKQQMIQNVSMCLSKNRSMQQLEQKLRQRILQENQNYVEEEVRKKTHLLRLNLSKQFEEEKNDVLNKISEEFNLKLENHLSEFEQLKQQLTLEYQVEKEKLQKIEQESKQLNQSAISVDEMNQEIDQLEKHLQMLEQTKQELKNTNKIPKKNTTIKNTIKHSPLQSPYQSAIKNQLLNELYQYDGIQIVDFESIPELFHIEKQLPPRLHNNTQESQLISFNISQPSIVPPPKEQLQQEECKITTQENSRINENKQDTLIDRLEQMCKDKLKESRQSQKQSQIIPLDQFEQLFIQDPKDNANVKTIKQLRTQLQQKFQDDLSQEDTYFSQLTYLKFNFIHQFPKQQQDNVRDLITQLISIWNKGHLSFKQRLNQISRCQSMDSLKYLLQEVTQEYEENQQIIEKLQQRQSFRSQIQKEQFNVAKNRKVFQALKCLSQEIKKIVPKNFMWREVEVSSILLVDQLEQELIEKEEMKDEIRKKAQRILR